MHGADITQEDLFSYRTLEARIPKKYQLRTLQKRPAQSRHWKTAAAIPRTISKESSAAIIPMHQPDSDARQYKTSEGDESQLAFLRHALLENRNGFVADVLVIQASATSEREAT